MKNFFITGDCHGRVAERLEIIKNSMGDNFQENRYGVIILGDVGFNYWGGNSDKNKKAKCNNYGFFIYCLRGNHEKRPSDIEGMLVCYDAFVHGYVYMEEDFPNIRYFIDGGEYLIDGYTVLTIGGAYSVDKWYRLIQASGRKDGFSGWFENEQLNENERDHILRHSSGKYYDFIFTHTCPISNMPTDLFLSCVDQSTVDNSMEEWLDEVKKNVNWFIWCFGHHHADRIEAAYIEQFYMSFELLEDVFLRWSYYKQNNKLPKEDIYKEVSPFFLQEVKRNDNESI